jgi:apolipoprotein N-acyltransferase
MLERREPNGESTVRAIIAAARQAKPAPARGAWLCGAVSALLWYLSYFPANWGALAFLAPVPLLLLVRIERRTRHMYFAIYSTWLVATLAAIGWMAANGPMVAAWIGLSCYIAIYPTMFVVASRIAVHRLRVPFVLAVPVSWTGLEFLRAHLMTGFPWYLIGHTQWRWTTMIQISDLVGVYGVSFVVMACAAAVALCVPAKTFARLRLLAVEESGPATLPNVSSRSKLIAVASALALLVASLTYGVVRMSGEHFSPGPRVALIQGNFPSILGKSTREDIVWKRHHQMTSLAVPYQPSFVIWPESAYRWKLLEAQSGTPDAKLAALANRLTRGELNAQGWKDAGKGVREMLGDLATQAHAAFITGLSSYVVEKDGDLRRYNSATFAVPEVGVTGRYDKRHRVVFGEYVPLREELPFMQALSPYTDDSSIDAGAGAKLFRHAGYTVSPLICYEDTVPDLVRNIVRGAEADGGDGVDLLVNVSNDGWFYETSEQPQHLATSLFRAVETRTPLARSANTGISAVIDGDGRLVRPVAYLDGDSGRPTSMMERGGRLKKDNSAVLVADVPLDSRRSLYVRFGDWFAGLCAASAIFCLCWGAVPRGK